MGVDTVVVLAAGEGTRMRSATPKVMHSIAGRTLLGHVLTATAALQATKTLVVVGHAQDVVTAHLADIDGRAIAVVQEEQLGTGHALRVALDAAPDVMGTVVVLYGDLPLITSDTIAQLVDRHVEARAVATLLTARMPDPAGLGRIVRGPTGQVEHIVEERDADESQRTIDEINAGVYVFEVGPVRDILRKLSTDNAQGEEYLTDAIAQLLETGQEVAAVAATDWRETVGVNDCTQLAAAAAILRERKLHAAMIEGTTITDPTTTWIDADVVLEPDALIEPFTRLRGTTVVRRGATVGPYADLTDTTVGERASVVAATCVGAEIGPEATVGPYTYLRPGTRLGRGAKAGGFVEMKNTVVGDDSKVPHLSYVGDTTIGERSNIGAGTITCNYDGSEKHLTTIGDDVFVGSNNTLVAPLEIGDAAYTAAGSTINMDVPEEALAFGRAKQVVKKGRGRRRRMDATADEPGGTTE